MVVSASKHNTKKHVAKTNRRKETAMKEAAETRCIEVQANAEVAVRNIIAGQLRLKFKKLAATTSLGLAAFAASLP